MPNIFIKKNNKTYVCNCYDTAEKATPENGSCLAVKKDGGTYYLPLWKKSVPGGIHHTPVTVKKDGVEYWIDTRTRNLVSLKDYASSHNLASDYDLEGNALPLENQQELTYIIVDNDASNAFEEFYGNSLNGIEATWDMSHVTNTSYMFSCSSIESLNISDWDVSNITNMSYMFNECDVNKTGSKLLDLSNWNTSNVTNMEYTFSHTNCSLNISNWNTSNVTNMSYTFRWHGFSSTTNSLDLSRWDTSNVTDMSGMFQQCSLDVLDISNFSTSSTTNMTWMFDNDDDDETAYINYIIIDSPVFKFQMTDPDIKYWRPGQYTGEVIPKILVPRALLNTYKTAENWSLIADRFEPIEDYAITRHNGQITVKPKNFDLHNYASNNNLEDKSDLTQEELRKLTNIIVASDASHAFGGSWDEDPLDMMGGCTELQNLNTVESTWDVSNVTNIGYMFCNCTNLRGLEISQWNVSNVTNMEWAFQYCSSLEKINVSEWNTSNVQSLYGTFCQCSSLISLDLSKWDTSSVTNMSHLFMGCTKLEILDISNFDSSSLTLGDWNSGTSYMFTMCDNLKYIIIESPELKFIPDKDTSTDLSLNSSAKILVPQKLIASYKANSFWSEFANNFDAIENYKIVRKDGEVFVRALIDLKTYQWNENTNEYPYPSKKDVENLKYAIIAPDASHALGGDIDEGIEDYYGGTNFKNLLDIEATWDTSNVTNMANMFCGSDELNHLDISNWDTSNVTNMSLMFCGCKKISCLDVSKWDTSKVTDMNGMFGNCVSLTSLDLSKWDTSKVTDMNYMFTLCNFDILDISNFDSSSYSSSSSYYDHPEIFAGTYINKYLIIGSPILKFIPWGGPDFASTAKILVPRDLIDAYKTHSNWSSCADYFDAIENYDIVRSHGQVTVTPK